MALKIGEFILGAAKAVVAGLFLGGGALAIWLGVDPELVAIVEVILGPLGVYMVPNRTPGGLQESAVGIGVDRPEAYLEP